MQTNVAPTTYIFIFIRFFILHEIFFIDLYSYQYNILYLQYRTNVKQEKHLTTLYFLINDKYIYSTSIKFRHD